MTDEELLYISCCLKEASKSYNFNREWSMKRLKESSILLPILEDKVDVNWIKEMMM